MSVNIFSDFLTIVFCEMKGSLIIVGFFILGIAAGLSGMVPESIIDGDLTFYALCALLLCVGIGIGSDRNIVTKFKSLDERMALLPLGTVIGTFAGSLVVSFILSGRSPLDSRKMLYDRAEGIVNIHGTFCGNETVSFNIK